MELYNIYSHKMAINTHYIQERTTFLYSQSKKKLKKKIEEKLVRSESLKFFLNFIFRFFLLLVFSIVQRRLEGVSTYGLLAGHTLTIRQKVALRKNMKCGTQIFFRTFFFFKFFFSIFSSSCFFDSQMLVYRGVHLRLGGPTHPRHEIESGTQKKFEMWHLHFFFFSNFFPPFFFF